MSSNNDRCFQCQEVSHMACYCPHIQCYDCDNYRHVAMDCPDKIPPLGTPACHRTDTNDRSRRSSSRHHSHTRCSCHDHRDWSRFSCSWSWPCNHSYRSSSCQDPHRSCSISFHRSSHCNFSHDRSSSSYHCHHNTPHRRPSSHRNTSHNDSRSWHRCRKPHYKPDRGSSSTSWAPSWKHKDKRHKLVTIDDPPSEYYSSDDNDSNSRWWFKLDVPSPTTHSQRGLPSEDIITIAHITDCPTVTVHAGKCYQALIDSGAAISLIRHTTYKQIEDCYKTPIQPTAAKLNTADGSPMATLGSTALHLCIADFKFTHNVITCNQLPDTELIFSIGIQKKFSLSYAWDKDQQCYIQWNGRFLAFTHATTQKSHIGTVKSTLKVPSRHNGVVLIKISGPLITTDTGSFCHRWQHI